MNAAQLTRFNEAWIFDTERLSQFNWLYVTEIIASPQMLDSRFPRPFSYDLNQDFGAIDPHKRRFPPAVEDALFALLLLPWEDWSDYSEVNWAGFTVPWIYTVTDDIFHAPNPPPTPDTLSWQPDFYIERYGEEVEIERPIHFPLLRAVPQANTLLNDMTWNQLMSARQSPLFETPIAHFLVRGFLSDGIDEFLAHILVIEAALGLPIDAKRRPPLPGNPGATDRVASRLSVLLSSNTAGDDFRKLFDLRNEFVHGRTMSSIPGSNRLLARRLARQTVNALIKAALETPAPSCRESYLNDLLTKGWVAP